MLEGSVEGPAVVFSCLINAHWIYKKQEDLLTRIMVQEEMLFNSLHAG